MAKLLNNPFFWLGFGLSLSLCMAFKIAKSYDRLASAAISASWMIDTLAAEITTLQGKQEANGNA